MSNKHDFTLDIISSIDDDIVEKNLKKRYELWQRMGNNGKNVLLKVLAFAACSCLVVTSLIFILNNILPSINPTGKQIPIYQGMTVSDTPEHSESLKLDSITDVNRFKPMAVLTSRFGAPLKKGGNDADLSPNTDTPYYAMKNEDIYIFVHILNPDDFEILSFTLNGVKYASNMFEDGSDLETLILKYNVGDVEGVQQYTIDAIKYVDGEDIKDVRMDGDRTVEVIVNADSDVIDFNASFDGWVLNINPEWSSDFAGSKEILSLAVYEGEALIKELSPIDRVIKGLPAGHRLMLIATYSENGAEKTIKYIFDTPRQSEGLLVVNGVVTGIGNCSDTVLYIDMPIADNAFKENKYINTVYMSDNVTSIGENAFSGNISLSKVILPERLEEIKKYTFENCSSLEYVDIPESVKSIGIRAFYGSALKSVVVPNGVTEISNLVFSNCTKLENVELSNGLKVIGVGAFEKCTSLLNIDLPESLTEIGGSAFEECTSLTNVVIPDSVTRMSGSIFKGCENLQSVTVPFLGPTDNMIYPLLFLFSGSGDPLYNSHYVPDSLKTVIITKETTIISRAFYNCTGLKTVFIPKEVSTIGMEAFYRCEGLTDIYYGGSESDWEKITVGKGNDILDEVTVHFNCSASDVPN